MTDSMRKLLSASYKGDEIIEYIETIEKAFDEACMILEEESARKESFWNKETWKEWCICQDA